MSENEGRMSVRGAWEHKHMQEERAGTYMHEQPVNKQTNTNKYKQTNKQTNKQNKNKQINKYKQINTNKSTNANKQM